MRLAQATLAGGMPDAAAFASLVHITLVVAAVARRSSRAAPFSTPLLATP